MAVKFFHWDYLLSSVFCLLSSVFCLLHGGQDKVVLAQGNGVDTINNFHVGQTRLGLSGSLTFADLAITQVTGATLIEIAATGEDLARLSWVQANCINADSFVMV